MYEEANDIFGYYKMFLESVKFHVTFIHGSIYPGGPKPTMQSLQLIIDALRNNTINIQQQQQIISVLTANPNLMIAFINGTVINQQQQHPFVGRLDTLRREIWTWDLSKHESELNIDFNKIY